MRGFRFKIMVSSSHIFGNGLAAPVAAGRISSGLNSLRPESTLSLMLNHLTLLMQACMKQYAIPPLSPLRSGKQENHTFVLQIGPISPSLLRKVEFPLSNVKFVAWFSEKLIIELHKIYHNDENGSNQKIHDAAGSSWYQFISDWKSHSLTDLACHLFWRAGCSHFSSVFVFIPHRSGGFAGTNSYNLTTE